MFRFKFQQNRILNEEFDFWKGEGGGQGDSILKFEYELFLVKMVCFKFK